MNESQLRRRIVTNARLACPLVYQLVIMLRSRKEMMYLCTRSSLALRIAGLCDLCLQNAIELNNNNVKVLKNVEDNVLKEFIYAISDTAYDPKKLVKALNGEMRQGGIKNLRNKVYKEMAKRNLIKTSKMTVYKKIIVQNDEMWQLINSSIAEEIKIDCLSTRNIVLLMCLDYVNKMESILIANNETVAKLIVDFVKAQKDKIIKRQYSQDEELIYEFLRFLI